MISEGTRQFDLYDFFSVLIPGVTFLLSLFPFFPESTPVLSTGVLIALIALGFVAGRAIHASSVFIERLSDGTTHRDTFVNALLNTTAVSEGLADSYYRRSTATFGSVSLPESRDDLKGSDCNPAKRDLELEMLYTLTRSHIHLDARGRSRTFQAVFDFYRNMLTTCALLFLIYAAYTLVIFFEIPADGWVSYQSYLASLGLAPAVVFFAAAFVFLFPFTAFRMVRSDYREYFIQYLMADFVVLHKDAAGDHEFPSDEGGQVEEKINSQDEEMSYNEDVTDESVE